MCDEDEELDERYLDYYDNYDLYMKKYIIPEVYASQLASYYYRDLMTNETLKQYIGGIGDAFNVSVKFEDIRKDIEEILKIKYNLIITNDEPVTIKRWK